MRSRAKVNTDKHPVNEVKGLLVGRPMKRGENMLPFHKVVENTRSAQKCGQGRKAARPNSRHHLISLDSHLEFKFHKKIL